MVWQNRHLQFGFGWFYLDWYLVVAFSSLCSCSFLHFYAFVLKVVKNLSNVSCAQPRRHSWGPVQTLHQAWGADPCWQLLSKGKVRWLQACFGVPVKPTEVAAGSPCSPSQLRGRTSKVSWWRCRPLCPTACPVPKPLRPFLLKHHITR